MKAKRATAAKTGKKRATAAKQAAAPKKKAAAPKRAAAPKKAAAPKRAAAPKQAAALKVVTLAAVRDALDAAGFALPHGDASGLPKPYALATETVTMDELRDVSGTVVVVGDLRVKGDVALRRIAGLPTLVVTGDVMARHVYADAFVVVGGTLSALTLVGDVGWDGGIFVGGLEADTAVLKDTSLELIGRGAKDRLKVRRLADLEKLSKAKKAVPELFDLDPDDVPAYAFFLTLPR